MVVIVSRKIQVILLLAVVMHGSLVIGADKDEGFAAKAKEFINGLVPTKGKIFEYQAKIIPAFVGVVGFGGLFLAYKNNKLDDPKLLGSFATLATVATGSTLYGTQGFTPQGQNDNCEKRLNALNEHKLVSAYKDANPQNDIEVFRCIFTAIESPENDVVDIAQQQIHVAEQELKSVNAGIKSLGTLKDIPTLIKCVKNKGKEYTAEQAAAALSDKAKEVELIINNLKLVVTRFANTKDVTFAKMARIQEKQYQLLRTSIQSFVGVIAVGMSAYFGSYLVDKYSK